MSDSSGSASVCCASSAASRRWRRPRASSVPSASRCGCQKRRNGSNHAAACSRGSGVDRVEPADALGAHRREARLPQHAEVLRDGGLGDAELALHVLADLAGAALALREEFEDAPANRIAENVECVHGIHTCPMTYISQESIIWPGFSARRMTPWLPTPPPSRPSRSSAPARWAGRSLTGCRAPAWPPGE